jgi:hypothetical protein
MSTGAEIREAVAKVLGVPASSEVRRMETLRLDNLVPTAAQGGGKGAVEFENVAHVHYWLSLPSPKPGEAAKLVRQLDALPFRGSSPHGNKAPGWHLGSALGATLEKLAVPLSRGETLDPASWKIVQSWQMSVCLEPLSAQISMNDGDGIITYYFAQEYKPRAPMSHIIMFTGQMLMIFGNLLANTYIRQNAARAIQFLDATKPAKLGQEREDVGSRQREPTPPTNQFPPQEPVPLNEPVPAKGAGGISTPEGIREDDGYQHALSAGLVTLVRDP